MVEHPVPPVLSRVPDLYDEAGGTRAWFFDEAATLVNQTQCLRMDVTLAKFLTGPVEEQLQRRYVSAGRKVTYLQDWRTLTGVEGRSWDLLVGWGRSSITHCHEVVLQVSPHANSFLGIAVHTGTSILRVARMPIYAVDDIERRILALQGPP